MALKDIFRFSTLLHKFREIERVVFVNDSERKENDVEHSYMLAMLGWYIASSKKLSLDRDKIIRYALIHDLVEVYAGDTYIYEKDKEFLKSKEAREEEARKRIAQEFPEFPDLHETIQAYELKSDRESRFVYALDKVQPVLNIYLDGGKTWKWDNVTLSMLREYKDGKVKVSPEVLPYWEELVALLTEKETELFPQPVRVK